MIFLLMSIRGFHIFHVKFRGRKWYRTFFSETFFSCELQRICVDMDVRQVFCCNFWWSPYRWCHEAVFWEMNSSEVSRRQHVTAIQCGRRFFCGIGCLNMSKPPLPHRPCQVGHYLRLWCDWWSGVPAVMLSAWQRLMQKEILQRQRAFLGGMLESFCTYTGKSCKSI